MALNAPPYNPMQNAAGNVGLYSGIGIAPPASTQWGHTHTVTANYDPPWQPDECGRTVIRKIENGFIVVFQKSIGATQEQYYCETMKDVGDRITACMVKHMLNGETTA